MPLTGEWIRLNPIGTVHTKASDEEIRLRASHTESEIEMYPQYADALVGLEGFSHVFVLGYFHKLREEQIGPLKVRPKRLLSGSLRLEDLPEVGVLALDSPTRPNPIGLSLVRLVQIREGRKLEVLGLDFFDGTPILDIKPYQPQYRAEAYSMAEWYTELREKAGHP